MAKVALDLVELTPQIKLGLLFAFVTVTLMEYISPLSQGQV